MSTPFWKRIHPAWMLVIAVPVVLTGTESHVSFLGFAVLPLAAFARFGHRWAETVRAEEGPPPPLTLGPLPVPNFMHPRNVERALRGPMRDHPHARHLRWAMGGVAAFVLGSVLWLGLRNAMGW